MDRNKDVYLNFVAEKGLVPTHTYPTHDRTCLDHIMLRSKSEARALVLHSSVTDHNAVVLALYQLSSLPKSRNTMPKTDWESIVKHLGLIEYNKILKNEDVNEDAEKFVSTLSNAIQSHTREVNIPCRSKIIKPWVTPGLLRCINNRNRLHRMALKSANNEIIQITYKRYRSFCNKNLT